MSNKTPRGDREIIENLVEEVVATATAEWSVLRDLEFSSHRPLQEHNLAFNYKQRFDKAIDAIDAVMKLNCDGISLQTLIEHVSITSDLFADDLEKHFANR